jgi:hypothetical protein
MSDVYNHAAGHLSLAGIEPVFRGELVDGLVGVAWDSGQRKRHIKGALYHSPRALLHGALRGNGRNPLQKAVATPPHSKKPALSRLMLQEDIIDRSPERPWNLGL